MPGIISVLHNLLVRGSLLPGKYMSRVVVGHLVVCAVCLQNMMFEQSSLHAGQK